MIETIMTEKIGVPRIELIRYRRVYRSPMRKLEATSTEELRTPLDEADEAKAAKWLMVALANKDDVLVTTLAERYGISQSTIYHRLDRLDKQPLADAMWDKPKSVRPPKLSSEQRAEVETWMDRSPRDFGYDAEEWTAEHLHN